MGLIENEVIRVGEIMEMRRLKWLPLSKHDREYADTVLTKAKRIGYNQSRINSLLEEGAINAREHFFKK